MNQPTHVFFLSLYSSKKFCLDPTRFSVYIPTQDTINISLTIAGILGMHFSGPGRQKWLTRWVPIILFMSQRGYGCEVPGWL